MSSAPQQHYLEKEFLDLLRSREAFELLESGAVDGFWYWDLENPEQEWMSPGFWRACGFDPAKRAHLASEWQDLISPEDRELTRRNFQRHCEDPGYPFDQLVRCKTANGGTVTVRRRGVAIRENGVPVRMLGAHTIIHDAQGHNMDPQLGELVEMSGDAILAWSQEDGILRWNLGAVKLYGVGEADALGSCPHKLTQAKYAQDWSEIEQKLRAGLEWSGLVERVGAQGRTCITSTRLKRIQVRENTTLFLQIDRDVTQQHRAEEQQRVLTREMHHRVKNLFSVIQSLVNMSARFETDAQVLGQKISARISALASAHLLSLEESQDMQLCLGHIFRVVLAPFHRDQSNLTITGEDVRLPQRCVNPLGLILYEMASNTTLHGAWLHQGGRVDVNWDIRQDADGKRWVDLTWQEFSDNHTAPTSDAVSKGFGNKLITISTSQLNGTVDRHWTQSGLKLILKFSIEEAIF